MKKNNPLISVVMPVYNAEKYLDEAITSLLIQSYENFEILAINDGSTDSSVEILKKYASIDTRVKIISQKNKGIVAVLNRGIDEAKGEYIARMDADDVSFPNRFKDQIETFQNNPDADLVYGDFEVIDEQSRFMYRELTPPLNEDIQEALFVRNPIAHGSVMFKKDIIERVGYYSDEFGPTEDLELWMRISRQGILVGTGSSLYRWRVNTTGITMTNNKESQKRGKEHSDNRWNDVNPVLKTRAELIETGRYYLEKYPKFGHYYKLQSLEDRAQIATKLMRKGKALFGMQQLFVIASTGRTGLRAVSTRISILINIYFKKIIGKNS